MKNFIVVFGVLSGSVSIGGIVATIVFGVPYQWLGYLIMLISFTMIYIAMRQFREEVQGGVLKLRTGLKLGVMISIVASLIYVVGWELYLFLTDYSFVGNYINSVVEAQRTSGVSEAELASLVRDMEIFREKYGSIFFRSALSLVEIFPVGILISVVSAVSLKT